MSAADQVARVIDGAIAHASGRTGAGRLSNLRSIIIAGAIFGAVMGAHRFGQPGWVLGSLYSALKTPLLVVGTTAICLPACFVLSSLLGLRPDFRASLGAISSGQASQAISLASLSPVLAFAYVCGVDHRWAVLLSGLLFLVGTAAGFEIMARRYRPLIARRPRHRIMLATWLVMYVFTGIQAGWMFRPFIGSPGLAVSFVRDEPLSNAYVTLWNLIVSGVSRPL